MNRRDFPGRVAQPRWLLAMLFFSLLLVACERPLQEDVTLAPETPSGAEDVLSTPATIEPGASPAATSDLLPTPSVAAPGADGGTETGEQPATTAPAATAEPGGAEATAAPTPGPTEDVVHTVVAGDTLGKIAEQYGISVEAIAQANNIVNIHSLEVGQQLLIPLSGDTSGSGETGETGGEAGGEERVHTVRAGETLFRIGQQYGFTVDELAAYNNLANPNQLEVGQQIRIPPEGWSP